MRLSVIIILIASGAHGLQSGTYPPPDVSTSSVSTWSPLFSLTAPKPSIVTRCVGEQDWALTFSDGPTSYTQNVLNALALTGTKATFFVVGSRVLENPTVLQLIHSEGHEIGLATWSDTDLTTLSNDEIIAELLWNMKIVQDVAKITPRLLRVPFNSINVNIQAAAASLGLKIVSYSADSQDWMNLGDASMTKSHVLAAIKSLESQDSKGVITLQHDLFENATLFESDVVNSIKASGYSLKTISDCILVNTLALLLILGWYVVPKF